VGFPCSEQKQDPHLAPDHSTQAMRVIFYAKKLILPKENVTGSPALGDALYVCPPMAPPITFEWHQLKRVVPLSLYQSAYWVEEKRFGFRGQ
jgi:hypothetical protein